MISLEAVCSSLASIAPLRLAEDWDNVGLLVGNRRASIAKVMTCLTVTPNVVSEAVEQQVGLIVAHHPLPFKPLARITSDSVAGEMLLRLIGAGVAVYSAHTAFDSAAEGINQRWSELLSLQSVETLVPTAGEATKRTDSHGESLPLSIEGTGRWGRLAEPESLHSLVCRAASAVGATSPRLVGDPDRKVSKIGLACGSGGSFLSAARRRGCDVLITGEATFHACLEAEACGVGLGLLGHYWSERFAMEGLAQTLESAFPKLSIWASNSEHDPLFELNI
ncbi:MAG: Nif3-like dinuclear metal center hexameric protein [Rhodopirellula sp.]|nr:Nif3-like dinuclear metal center hexameric protein [Rhodopirellula sp.]OUX52586.1 MAG: Nif3-like dinuclear metal center hexameric protein [Rhodopirellula sp. TMED283]